MGKRIFISINVSKRLIMNGFEKYNMENEIMENEISYTDQKQYMEVRRSNSPAFKHYLGHI